MGRQRDPGHTQGGDRAQVVYDDIIPGAGGGRPEEVLPIQPNSIGSYLKLSLKINWHKSESMPVCICCSGEITPFGSDGNYQI